MVPSDGYVPLQKVVCIMLVVCVGVVVGFVRGVIVKWRFVVMWVYEYLYARTRGLLISFHFMHFNNMTIHVF